MLKDFKDFIAKGNVIDLAVAVIIAGAFGTIVASLTDEVIMPVVGALFGGADFSSYFILLTTPEGYEGSLTDYAALKEAGAAMIGYGAFITAIINFVILAFIIFLLVRYDAKPLKVDAPLAGEGVLKKTMRSMFRAIFDPLMELIARMKWGALLVLLLALTYRFTDSVWGAFAYPFYLDDRFGALHHTLDDVAIASKFFGVIMTIVGAAIGAAVIAFMGRMPVLLMGAILAAATNLLFADLSAGGAAMDAFLQFTHLGAPLREFASWAATISPEATSADQSQRMARLMMAIAGENLAGGFASVAIVAFLTSVVNPRFAAVQYALLASLSMLIGTLGRPWLGQMIETDGYFTVFIVTFWLGMIAVALCAVEWIRQARQPQSLPDAIDS